MTANNANCSFVPFNLTLLALAYSSCLVFPGFSFVVFLTFRLKSQKSCNFNRGSLLRCSRQPTYKVDYCCRVESRRNYILRGGRFTSYLQIYIAAQQISFQPTTCIIYERLRFASCSPVNTLKHYFSNNIIASDFTRVLAIKTTAEKSSFRPLPLYFISLNSHQPKQLKAVNSCS